MSNGVHIIVETLNKAAQNINNNNNNDNNNNLLQAVHFTRSDNAVREVSAKYEFHNYNYECTTFTMKIMIIDII